MDNQIQSIAISSVSQDNKVGKILLILMILLTQKTSVKRKCTKLLKIK